MQAHSYMSCSIAELSGFGSFELKNLAPLFGLAHSIYRAPRKGDATCSIGFIATQYRGTVQETQYPPNGGTARYGFLKEGYTHYNGDHGQYLGPKALIIWSDHTGPRGWGDTLQKQVETLELGSVHRIGPYFNPCTNSRDICFWSWLIDRPKFEAWYKAEVAKRGVPEIENKGWYKTPWELTPTVTSDAAVAAGAVGA